MQELNNLDLQSLNIYIETWFELSAGVIPLYIHIKDINDFHEEGVALKIDTLRGDTRLNKTDNPLQSELLGNKVAESMDYFLKFVDRRKLFNGKSFEEANNINLREDLDEGDFVRLRDELIYYINYIKQEFIERCKLLLDYDRQFPQHYKTKNEMPKDVSDNIIYPIGMTMIQSNIEYPSTILFEENIGKPIAQHSFREVQLKAMYIHMKNKIEGFLNQYQSWKIEKDRPQTK